MSNSGDPELLLTIFVKFISLEHDWNLILSGKKRADEVRFLAFHHHAFVR